MSPNETVSPVTPAARTAFQAYVVVGVAVFLLMMLAGSLMRATNAAATFEGSSFSSNLF